MLIAQCPNCRARYRADRKMLDSYGGFFRCGKCDYKFNYYEQMGGSPEDDAGSASDPESAADKDDLIAADKARLAQQIRRRSAKHRPDATYVEPQLRPEEDKTDHNITLNSYDEIDDELREPQIEPTAPASTHTHLEDDEELAQLRRTESDEDDDSDHSDHSDDGLDDDSSNFVYDSLITQLAQEYDQQRDTVVGSAYHSLDHGQSVPHSLPTLEPEPAEHIEIVDDDDTEDETRVIGSLGAVGMGMKYFLSFLFWTIAALALFALLIYQLKPTFSDDWQQAIEQSAVVEYFCKHFECEPTVDVTNMDIVVSRMELFPTPSEPLNVSLFILNRLKEPQNYPTIRLSIKNLQGLTLGQRFFKPGEYLENPEAVITGGNIGKVILKLENPPDNAVGFEATLH